MPTTIDIESQRMLLGSTPVRKIYQGTSLLGARIAELFANGEQGVWYDPSDLSTLFQDAAGTIPVTGVEQPVGLMLDKSGRGNHAAQVTTTARPVLSARYNLVNDSEFSLGVTAPFAGVTASSLAGYAGAAAFSASGQTIYAYKIGSNVGAAVTFSFVVRMDDGQPPSFIGGASGSIMRDFSVVVRGGAYSDGMGAHKVTEIAEGVYRVSVTTTTPGLNNNFGVVKYTTNSGRSFVVTAYDVRVAESPSIPEYQRVGAASINADAYDAAGFPPYLSTDGVDDFLVTNSNVNFSATPAVSVVLGVYKNTDSARAIVAELTTSFGAVGGFSLEAPSSATANFSHGYNGGSGAASFVSPSTYPAPKGYVISVKNNLLSNYRRFYVNGALVAQNTTVAGPGPFANDKIWLFSRAGSQHRFSGRFYGLVVCGRDVSTPELLSVTQSLRNKSRAY